MVLYKYMQEINLSGKIFGRLEVMYKDGRNKANRPLWLCQCDCGNRISLTKNALTTGNTKSCGCLFKELLIKRQTTHGKSDTLTYRIWQDMKDRCINPKHHCYDNYGGRNIKVCDHWLSFENFLKDMGEKPEGLTLDRTNNDIGYCKKNCNWVTIQDQSRNKRSTLRYTYKGETKCLKEWADVFDINYQTLHSRINRGMTFINAIKK